MKSNPKKHFLCSTAVLSFVQKVFPSKKFLFFKFPFVYLFKPSILPNEPRSGGNRLRGSSSLIKTKLKAKPALRLIKTEERISLRTWPEESSLFLFIFFFSRESHCFFQRADYCSSRDTVHMRFLWLSGCL